jgi:hypothetical protein
LRFVPRSLLDVDSLAVDGYLFQRLDRVRHLDIDKLDEPVPLSHHSLSIHDEFHALHRPVFALKVLPHALLRGVVRRPAHEDGARSIPIFSLPLVLRFLFLLLVLITIDDDDESVLIPRRVVRPRPFVASVRPSSRVPRPSVDVTTRTSSRATACFLVAISSSPAVARASPRVATADMFVSLRRLPPSFVRRSPFVRLRARACDV